jgi:zinc protease
LDQIKQVIFDEINQLIEKGVEQKELEKSKNGIKANFIYSMQNLDTVADYLNHYNFYVGEPNSFEFDLNRYNSVTNDSLKQAVKSYLTKNFVELRIIPKENKI